MRGVFFISKTTNWFDPKQCMNQVSDEGSGESLIVLLKIYKESDKIKLIIHKDKGKL